MSLKTVQKCKLFIYLKYLGAFSQKKFSSWEYKIFGNRTNSSLHIVFTRQDLQKCHKNVKVGSQFIILFFINCCVMDDSSLPDRMPHLDQKDSTEEPKETVVADKLKPGMGIGFNEEPK